MKKSSLIPIAVCLIILAGAVFRFHKLVNDNANPAHEDDSNNNREYSLASMPTGEPAHENDHSFAAEVEDTKEQLVSFNEDGNRLYCWETIEQWLMEDTNRLEDSQLAALAFVFLDFESDWDIVKYISCGYNSSEISPSVFEYSLSETFLEVKFIIDYYTLINGADTFLSGRYIRTSDIKKLNRQAELEQILHTVVSSAKTISVDATEEPDVVLFDKINDIVLQIAT